jgi:hypothetical protein
MFDIISIVQIRAREDATTISYEFICSILTEITSTIDFFQVISTGFDASIIYNISEDIITTYGTCVDTYSPIRLVQIFCLIY